MDFDFNKTAAAALLPPGFAALMDKIAAKNAPPPPKRRGVLADVERAVALDQEPPLLEFKSEANYTYNRHAQTLHKMWSEGDTAGLLAYPLNGKNTYSKALARYREILLDCIVPEVQ
jgi:hypothetical protein